MIALAVALGGNAAAAQECPGVAASPAYPRVVALRVDNDMFTGRSRDGDYTSGVQLSMVSANLRDHLDDPCLPAPARFLNDFLQWAQPGGFDQQNLVMTIQQGIFTPRDYWRTDLVEDDRPYAGVLLFGLGYNARLGRKLETTLLQVGVAGPASLARQSQRAIHRIVGAEEFLGWEHQIGNEVVVNLTHERSRRYLARPLGIGDLEWDANTHFGGAIGNFRTHANTGFELRFGYRLPDDFGSSPVRPAGNNTSPTIAARVRDGWSWNAFLAVDARWVLRDLSLDGNTFRDSHGVDRKSIVSEAALGLAVTWGRTKFAFARYFRSHEFHGQRSRPTYGSFTISRAL